MVEDVGTLEEIIAARDDPSAFGRTIRDLIEGCLFIGRGRFVVL